jgi:tetratricopeptide (TPR) repeat protein
MKERHRPSAETLTSLDKVLKMASESQNPQAVVSAQFAMGYGLLHAGELKSAEGWLLKALENARRIDLRVEEARILAFLSTLYRQLGDVIRTAEYTQLAETKGAAVGSRHFVAHSLANSAWLAYCRGETTLAFENAKKASQEFIDTKVPFAWLALIVLMAIFTDARDYDRAKDAAAAMLDPMQQRLPDDLTAALEGAVESWEQKDIEKTSEFLKQAVELAQRSGYL